MSSTDKWVYYVAREGKPIDSAPMYEIDYSEVQHNINRAGKGWVVFEYPGLVLIFNLMGNYVCVFKPADDPA